MQTVRSSLTLAFVIELCGITLGRLLGYSQFTSVGIGLVPALLLLYPVMKQWHAHYGKRLTFSMRVFAVAIMTLAAVLIQRLIA